MGKTSLLRGLRGEQFNPQEPTTHGLETNRLEIAHPSEPNVTMQLNTWDFGGQQIYHATHQFFLTNRSLFLLAWHARMGFEAGKLNTLPAGIPTWFIARAHRFSTNTHWRNGALFAHENHLALVQAAERDCTVQLSVRGPNPPNFFALLKDGLELTLARFPGIKIERKIPCLGHQGQACPHAFNYQQLLKRYENNKFTIECPETFEDVYVPALLYGWDWRTQDTQGFVLFITS